MTDDAREVQHTLKMLSTFMRTTNNEPKHLGLNSLSVFILPKPRTQ